MIELQLLKGLSIKDNYDSYRRSLNDKTLSMESLLILKDYEVYFELNPEHKEIDFSLFVPWFFNARHPFLDEKAIQEYRLVLQRLAECEVNTNEINTLFVGFQKKELYEELKNDLHTNQDISIIKGKLEQFETDNVKEDETENMDLKEALEATQRSNGYKWRLQPLQDYFKGGLILGDFILVAGYVGSGKTSFIASELSYMSQQLQGEQRAYWLSNEGDKKAIIPRLYCATLNCTAEDLTNKTEQAILAYTQRMNGDSNRIIVMNIQGWTAKDIEKLVKQKKPAILVVDLLDHINGFDKFVNKESSFEKYNRLYQWTRELATKHCPVIGVSQLNGDGEDNMFPNMSSLRGSRVDKQAAVTFQLNIGKKIGEDTTRYLSIVKEKLGWGELKFKCHFDPQRSRYYV